MVRRAPTVAVQSATFASRTTPHPALIPPEVAGSPRRRPRIPATPRGLRSAVIHRKLSLGSQSDRGERTIERLLSASLTCRLQQRSLFAYLSDVLTASVRGDSIPALA
jgi:hypothetical protein